MPSLIYNSCLADALQGNINFASSTLRMMLVTSGYTADKTHTKRSSITNEITGTNYTAGGAVITSTVSVDNTLSQVKVNFGNASWSALTASGIRAGVIYRSRGGAASADELVAYVDFGGDFAAAAGTFVATMSTPLAIQL
jgi:hypothetical protein